jgi:hypothetical protein
MLLKLVFWARPTLRTCSLLTNVILPYKWTLHWLKALICRPMALIAPAKSHAEVIVQAVAARDRVKAEAFAKKHSIPQVLNSYQGRSLIR